MSLSLLLRRFLPIRTISGLCSDGSTFYFLPCDHMKSTESKSTQEQHNRYAYKGFMLTISAFKQLCVEQSLPWLTWRQCVNTIHLSQSELA